MKTAIVLVFLFLLSSSFFSHAQSIGIGANVFSPDASSGLEVQFSNKGVLIPRVALTTVSDAVTISNPATSLLVFNSGTGGLSPSGFYYNAGTPVSPNWVRIFSGAQNDLWKLTGNAGTDDGTNFLGTTDNVPLTFRVNNIQAGRIMSTGATFLGCLAGLNNTAIYNTGIGYQTLNSNTTGDYNTAVGYAAMYKNSTGSLNSAFGVSSLQRNLTGVMNCAFGNESLNSNTSGCFNTAVGFAAMGLNSLGQFNIGIGYSANYHNITGNNTISIGSESLFNNLSSDNIAIGHRSQYMNTSGSKNISFGTASLFSSSTRSYLIAMGDSALFNNGNGAVGVFQGNYNIAVGSKALFSNTTGYNNAAIGIDALCSNTSGYFNIAYGGRALYANLTGSYNCGFGYQALENNTTAAGNSAFGHAALANNTTGFPNNAFGYCALFNNLSGNNNIGFGYMALYENVLANNNVAIGNYCLRYSTAGNNTAVGSYSLFYNSTGSSNTMIGYYTGYGGTGNNLNQCTFIGSNSNISVNRTNVTVLGYSILNAQCTADNQVLLGNTAVTQIRAQVGSITTYSDARFKSDVKNDVHGLDFIMKLNPVTFSENPEILHRIWGTPDSVVSMIDHSQIKSMRFIGLMAQDVESAMKECGWSDFPGIDIPNDSSQVYSLRYGDFIVPLVKSVQEQQKEIESQEKVIADQQSLIAQQQAVINDLLRRVEALEKASE